MRGVRRRARGGGAPREDAVAAAGRRLAAFGALRAVVAPVVEALLLTDQLLFLLEAGLAARLVPLFDPRISPRNMALVAAKREGSEGG